MPGGLRCAHRLAAGTWGQIEVEDGLLRFRASTTPPTDILLEPASVQAIPPEVVHEIEPIGTVRFRIQLFSVDRRESA